jgi:CheY-like chemotaxis protein
MHQVVMNLCTNAVYAMKNTGGRLDVAVEPVSLGLDSEALTPSLTVGDYLCLRVTDSGCGMDDDTRHKALDPFFTTKPEGEGTGLGLSVVHGIVRAHHGDIVIQSVVGEGTTVSVYLPVVATAAESPDKPVVVRDLPGNGEHVLVVDDERSLADMTADMLEDLGFKVSVQSRSEDALELFRAKPESFDLLLTDLTMPKPTGVELARACTQVKPGLPVLMCTGYSARLTPDEIQEAHISKVLLKPFGSEELAEALREVLAR